MPPAIERTAAAGNVGRNVSEIESVVEARILAIAREADPNARPADATGQTPFLPMAQYIDAVAPSKTTGSELNAAGYARQHGGMRLLVPTIVEWRQTRTDDPAGALTTPHNRIVIAMRLVRLDPVGVVGSVTFENHA